MTTPSPTTIPFAQYKRAFAFVAPYWRGLILVLSLGLFSTAVGLVQPYITRLLIDDALLPRDMHALVKVAALMVAVTVIAVVLWILQIFGFLDAVNSIHVGRVHR